MAAGRVARGGPFLHGRLLPAACRRTVRMTNALLVVHQVGARALVAFAVVLGVWGAYLYFRRESLTGGVRSNFLIIAGLTPAPGLPPPSAVLVRTLPAHPRPLPDRTF